jgi:predicted membrane chloride channel (bestrophin family)
MSWLSSSSSSSSSSRRLLSAGNKTASISALIFLCDQAATKLSPRSFSTSTSTSSTTHAPTNTNGRNGKNSQKKRKPEFYVPMSERDRRNVFDLDIYAGESRLARNHRTCPTRELYFQHGQWEKHKSPYRKFRHMSYLFQSAPFQRLLFPDLFCVTAVAAVVTYYNECVTTGASAVASTAMSMSPTVFAGATTAIGLLAGFRLNACYGRYNEGRNAWSETQSTLRDLARQTVMWIPIKDTNAQKTNNTSKDDDDDDMMMSLRTRLLRLCQAYPVALLFHLNDKGCHYNMKRLSRFGEAQFYDRVQVEFEAELADIYSSPSPPLETNHGETHDAKKNNVTTTNNALVEDDFDRICRIKKQRGHVPLEVITCMAETIVAATMQHNLNPVYVQQLEQKVQRLTKAMGNCERIAKTPLPTGFTRHSSRLLFLWSNCLPLALYPLLGPWATLPTTLLTSYAVLGIEDISVQLEEPFDVLPLRQFSNTMYQSIKAIESNYKDPITTTSNPATGTQPTA